MNHHICDKCGKDIGKYYQCDCGGLAHGGFRRPTLGEVARSLLGHEPDLSNETDASVVDLLGEVNELLGEKKLST